jgi:hypothetical protein
MCAATFNWCEDNGTLTSSHGTTQTGFGGTAPFPTDVNYKSVDNCTNNGGTAYSAAPIQAGNNSFPKYQYAYLSGSFNSISSCFYAHTAGTLGTGLALKGLVTSTYTTPSASTVVSGASDISSPVTVTSGFSVDFSTTGPWGSSPTSTLTSPGYTQYLVTQLATTSGAGSGDTSSLTLTIQYNET